MEFTPYTLPLIMAAAIALGLAFFVLRQSDVPGRVSFSILMLGVFVWSAGYALEISAVAESTKIFWAKMQYFGIAAVPLLDLTPFSFTLSGLAVAWGMRRFRFMGTVPVAHRPA